MVPGIAPLRKADTAMVHKFEEDYAVFGIILIDVDEDEFGSSRVCYANDAADRAYGELVGRTMHSIFVELTGYESRASALLKRLKEKAALEVEGTLNGRYVKYHSRYVRSDTDGRFIQAGLMDISESLVLRRLLNGTTMALERAAQAADEDTGQHVRRINAYAARLAAILGCDDRFVDKIANFARLHDIGKIKVAGLIKLPRQLTDEEFEQVKLHTTYGGKIVKGLNGLEMAHDIVVDHHEKYDGSGYPRGKMGDEISLAGRIVAIADVFDALVSKRTYKHAYSYPEAFEVITQGDGRVMPGHFDPTVLTAFSAHYKEFTALHGIMKD